MSTYTSWFSYITQLPIQDAELWNALSVLDAEFDAVHEARAIVYTYDKFYSGGVSTVDAALNAIADVLVDYQSPTAERICDIPSPGPALTPGTTVARWILKGSGLLAGCEFYVGTAPGAGGLDLSIRINGVEGATVTIPEGEHYPTSLPNITAIAFANQDVLTVYCTANTGSAADLAGYIYL